MQSILVTQLCSKLSSKFSLKTVPEPAFDRSQRQVIVGYLSSVECCLSQCSAAWNSGQTRSTSRQKRTE